MRNEELHTSEQVEAKPCRTGTCGGASQSAKKFTCPPCLAIYALLALAFGGYWAVQSFWGNGRADATEETPNTHGRMDEADLGPSHQDIAESLPSNSKNTEPADGEPPSSDSRLREMVLGTWEDDYRGHRTLTLRPDGTGTMVVELNGWEATVFAEKLTFHMEWAMNDGKLYQKTVSGEPKDKVDFVLNMMGDSTDSQVLDITDSRMLLLGEDGETEYDWRRVK